MDGRQSSSNQWFEASVGAARRRVALDLVPGRHVEDDELRGVRGQEPATGAVEGDRRCRFMTRIFDRYLGDESH